MADTHTNMGPVRTNREILTRGTEVYAKKQKRKAIGVEEIKYDQDARKYVLFLVDTRNLIKTNFFFICFKESILLAFIREN